MRKLKIVLLTSIILFLIMGISYGVSDTYDVKMYLFRTEFLVGDTVNIPVKIENINIENGIVAFSTILSYDENVLEEPVLLNASDWTQPVAIENLIHSTTATMQPIKENQEVMIMSFKIKDNAPLGKTNIVLSKFDVSDGETTIANEGASIELNIVEKRTEVADILLDNEWMTQRNMVISLIIGIVTIIIIILLTIYYIEHREREEKSNLLYEEVKGIPEEENNQIEKLEQSEIEEKENKEDKEEKGEE